MTVHSGGRFSGYGREAQAPFLASRAGDVIVVGLTLDLRPARDVTREFISAPVGFTLVMDGPDLGHWSWMFVKTEADLAPSPYVFTWGEDCEFSGQVVSAAHLSTVGSAVEWQATP